jgi:hypothetical protein
MSEGFLVCYRTSKTPIHLHDPVLLFDAMRMVGPCLQVDIIIKFIQLRA